MTRSGPPPSAPQESGPQRISVAIIERQGQFLIGMRPKGSVLEGYWEFPGGKVHTEETPPAAAEREAREETGLDVQVVRHLMEVRHEYPFGAVQLDFYLCQTGDATPLPPYQWVPRGSLHAYRFPDANAPLLELLASVLPSSS